MTEPNLDKDTSSQSLLNQIVVEHFKEKKQKRFWRRWRRIFFTLLVIAFSFYFFHAYEAEITARAQTHVGLIDLKGEIFDTQAASADNLSKSLESAYQAKGLKAVLFRIDSPGGSPVQADYMFNTIRYYHKKYPDVKSYAVCMDTCASAAYYVAAAADEIYANPSSLVGSIGVLYNGFGFVDAMQKLGVTRRLETAGRNKGFMDAFSPIDATQEKSLKTMLTVIHQRFIDQVKLGRGDRLKPSADLFTGMVWTGVQAKNLGLIDGFDSTGQLLRDVIKVETVYDYTEKHSVLDQLAKSLGAETMNQLAVVLGIKRPGFH
ncbi:MAG: S49 family peptidase [Gammaproteobacteria bacterium]|nr:S49 family peptidase [Gammaproteobacteria bacterium]